MLDARYWMLDKGYQHPATGIRKCSTMWSRDKAMSQTTQHSAVPFAILRKLRLVRQRKLFVNVAIAMVAALAVLLAAMGIAMLIDWLATLYDSRWRYVLTMAAIGAAALTGVGWLFVAWRRLLGIERIAGDVDDHLPQLAERWTTMTRLRVDESHPEVVHPAMLRRLASEATHWEPYVEPDQVVSMSALMRAMLGLTAVTAVLAMAVVLNSHEALVLIQRFWLPGSSISATQLVNVRGNVVVGRGEPLALAASVEGTPVERATLFLRSQADPQRAITLVAHGQESSEFSHRVRAVETPFEYRFRAGDGQTEWYSVDVADRPEIDKLQLKITPPAYTRQEAKSFDKLPPRVVAMEKSEFELALLPTIPVASAVLRLADGKQLPLTAESDGWFRWKSTLKEGFSFTLILTESRGLTNRRIPKCQVSVYPDKPPAVKVLTPDDKLAVRPDDTIQISFTASDDVGIGMAELLVYDEGAPATGGEPVPIAAIPIPLGDQQGARSVQETVDLDLSKFVVDDGSELSYEIRVREDRGEIAPQLPNQIASSPTAVNPPVANQATVNQPTGTQQAASQQAAADTSANSAPSSGATGQQTSTMTESTASASSASQASQTARTDNERSPQSGEAPPQVRNPSPRQVAERDGKPVEESSQQSAARQPASEQSASDKLVSSEPLPNRDPSSNVVPPSRNNSLEASNSPASNAKPSDATQRIADNAAKSSADAEKLAGNLPNESDTPERKPDDDKEPMPRTASSGRQSLSGDRSESSPQDSQASRQQAQSSSGQNPQSANQPASTQQQAPSASQSNGQPPTSSDQQQASSSSTPRPGDPMTRRSLDIAQSSSSNRMRLTVDKWAGSFEGQQRAKLEMAIGPELEALDKALEKGQMTARGVLDELETDKQWRGTHDRDVGIAERSTVGALEIVKKLQDRSKDTPYAFIGLQVADISLAHIEPARSGFWKALESEGDDRVTSVHDAWQHLGRARQLVAELRGQYERARREFQLAESVEKVKKMYQVFIENSQALLEMQDRDPTRYNRKMAEFELDEEYLKRLKEVLEMRRDLQAELARILAEDPRLLRRFMDALRYRSNNLREELADLVAEQNDLNREVRAWTLVEEADRPRIAKILMLRQVQDAAKLATAAGELQSRYQTWLPLDRESKDADLAAASKTVQEMATAASELNSAAQRFVTDSQRVTVATPAQADAQDATADAAAATPAAAPTIPDPAAAADELLADAQALYEQLNQLEVALRQIAAREQGAETAVFAANRLVETRRLIADSSAWVRQLRAHAGGNYTAAAEVDQYRLAMKTDELAGKLGSIEQTLAGIMQRNDNSLPAPIAEKAREFLTALDKQVSPNQLASVYALHNNQLPRATQRQKAAADALALAEKAYDDMMRMAIEELDKLPVQDPVADLLDDPTLDELLAQLEQELPIQELLGIPQRPSNLQIIGDWLRPGNGMGGGGGRMALNQLLQNNQQARRRLDRAYQRAIARALKEASPKRTVQIPKPAKLSDWNRLVSKLGDDLRQSRDKAPPEQYRRAIEQYFSQISRVVAENEDAAQ
jgi:hypothetical protein